MTIVKPKKENYMFACLPPLLWLLPAAAATAGASAGGGWDIGDADSDSFMVAHTHIAQHRESHPLQNDKELGKTTKSKLFFTTSPE